MTSSAWNRSLCLWKRTSRLEANKLAEEVMNFFPCKFFSSCQFAIQTYELSINWVNLCKFVASFPSIFAVSCTPHLLQKFREKGATYMLVFMFLFFFFPFLICVLQCTLKNLCTPGWSFWNCGSFGSQFASRSCLWYFLKSPWIEFKVNKSYMCIKHSNSKELSSQGKSCPK